MKAIINTNIILPDYMIANGVVIIENGTIVDYGKNIAVPENVEIIDAEGAFTGPGLIDIHTHAGGYKDFHLEPEYAARANLEAGVTSVFPALYFSMTKEEIIEYAKAIIEAKESGKAPNIAGIYMEAPYMNPKFGANKENNPWRNPIDKKDYLELLEVLGKYARVWGIAPERENIEEFVKDALKANPVAIFSVAHSEAEPYQIERLKKYGLKLATHHTNATGTIQKYPECRGVCVDETVWYNDDMYAEMISDKVGIHVDPYMQRLIKKIKGEDKLILISDASVDYGEVPSGYEEATDIVFDTTGEISGFKEALSVACRNVMYHTGSSLCQVFKFASTNPARLLRLDDVGEIAIGKRANLVITDALFGIKHVIFEGEIVK